MLDWLTRLIDPTGFPPRWQCGDGWTPFLGWLHILSDIGIWAAYTAIPVTMWLFTRKRRDIRFPPVFWLYVMFILSCGIGHLIEAGIFYWPVYRLSGMVKMVTAMVSLATVVALIKVMPLALSIPGLSKVNSDLRAEIKRRQTSENRFLTLVQASSSIIWNTSPQGGFITPQPAWEAYTGQTWAQYEGDGWTNAIHENDMEIINERWAQALANRLPYESRGRIWSQAHQAYRRFVAQAVPIINEQDEVTEWVGTITDIEEQSQLAAELAIANHDLEKKNRHIQRFLYSVSHDLKSPVVTMRGFAGFIRDDLANQRTDRMPQFVSRIDEAAQSMARALDDLLQLSRLGHIPAKPEPIDLAVVVREQLEQLEPTIQEHDAQVITAHDLPTVVIDAQHIRQLLQNLLTNALKYGCEGRRGAAVEIGWYREGNDLVLFVRDEGPGIPEQHHERIFEVFERLQNTSKGTGIGLSIVRQIAENYGGTATVESPPQGRDHGSVFMVRLPVELLVHKK